MPLDIPSRENRIDEAVTMLMNGSTVRQIAAHTGHDRRTVDRWLLTPRAKARIEAVRAETFSRVARSLITAGPIAIHTLVEVMTNPNNSSAARVTAATRVLEFGGHARRVLLGDEPSPEMEAATIDVEHRLIELAERLTNVPIIEATATDAPTNGDEPHTNGDA